MGQRLNIEVVNNGNVLANAYYHWSAYSSCAASKTEEIIQFIEENEPYEPSVAFAIKILASTGAGFNESELERVNNDTRFAKLEKPACRDRNVGLLSVTEEGIASTEMWEEGRVTIDLDDKCVAFSVLFEEEDEEEFKENWEMTFNDLPLIEDFDPYNISFDDFYKLIDIIDENPNGIRTQHGTVFTWIT